jgi:heterodisulfide reductase subunit B
MGVVLAALGAKEIVRGTATHCCGASLMATKPEAALVSVGAILGAAQKADAIVTVCPMCQMNLEAYQSEALKAGGGGREVSVLYLSQLMGLAFGLPESAVLLDKNLAVTDALKRTLRAPAAAVA